MRRQYVHESAVTVSIKPSFDKHFSPMKFDAVLSATNTGNNLLSNMDFE